VSGGEPVFPDPLGVREVVRPGATAHKAGLDVVRRLQALEQGALGRPGPGVVDGSVPVAVAAAQGRAEWINHRISASVFNDAAVSLTNNTTTALDANSEHHDYGDMHSTSVNTNRITVPRAGIYLVTAHVDFANSAAGSERLVTFDINASAAYFGTNESGVGDASGTDNTSVSTATVVQLSANDYVRCSARQRSGGALNATLRRFTCTLMIPL
jgi:hypothetical protein